MPVILRYRNIRVVIYPHDHDPPHVHVLAPGCIAKFYLDPVHCYYCRGFTKSYVFKLTLYLEARKDLLMESWNEYKK